MYVKRHGKIRCCAWCGQKIEVGEKYSKSLHTDGDNINTVYAHEECAKRKKAFVIARERGKE